MGIASLFGEVKTLVQATDPTVEFLLTAEALDFQGAPPRVVWELPPPGQEDITRAQTGPGRSPLRATMGRILWARETTCTIHVWIPGVLDTTSGVEYPDDNEDPDQGDVWLGQRVVQAIHQAAAGQYRMGKGGWQDRSMCQLGFVYTFQVTFLLGFWDTAQPAGTKTVTSVQTTVAYT